MLRIVLQTGIILKNPPCGGFFVTNFLFKSILSKHCTSTWIQKVIHSFYITYVSFCKVYSYTISI